MAAPARESLLTSRVHAADAAATVALGGAVAARCRPGMVVFLDGDLGAGKTTFARGFLNALGHTGAVKSPTYTLVEAYQTPRGPVYHFDLYRLNDPEELEAMGFREYFDGASLSLLEWPERAGHLAGSPDLLIHLAPEGEGRSVVFCAYTTRGVEAIPQ